MKMQRIYWGQGGDGGQGETKKMSLETENKILQRDNKRLRNGLEGIAKGAWTSSGDLAGATWNELIACRIAKETLEGVVA